MNSDTWNRLDLMFSESPIMCAEKIPTQDEVDYASHEIGIPFPQDYREFLLRYGGAMVGPYPVFGLGPVKVMGNEWSVIELTRRYRNDHVTGCDGWIVFSEDHVGNPVGMDSDGKVWIYDHDFGGVAQLSESFEEYIRTRCLAIDK